MNENGCQELRAVPRRYRPARPAVVLCVSSVLFSALLLGCTARPAASTAAKPQAASTQYPPRPTVTPPPFKLFHQTDSSLTLVTAEAATDDQIAAILWQLHDATRAHTFTALHLPQAFIDRRDPIVFFHLYRGSRCASEKYANKLPCGASYHAAGEYTLGSFHNRDRDDAALLPGAGSAETHQIELWDPDKPDLAAH